MSKAYLDPPDWYAGLPSMFAAACLLLTDAEDRVLLVKPNYRPHLALPGGVIEDGETPHDCAAREIEEELGLTVRAGDLLVVHWSPPDGDRFRSLVAFVFDGGTVADPARIRLQADELDDAAFHPWQEAIALLPPHLAPRLAACRRARSEGRTVYLTGGSA